MADICNHTWIPECAMGNVTNKFGVVTVEKKIFSDECDMFEYNCDFEEDFMVVNYTECFGRVCTEPPAALRIGDYRYVPDDRRMVYDPTDKYGTARAEATTKLTMPTTKKPDLPAYMLSGRRRFSPKIPFTKHPTAAIKRNKPTRKTNPTHKTKIKQKTKPTTRERKPSSSKTKATIRNKRKPFKQNKGLIVVVKKVPFMKNGKRYMKIIKAFQTKSTTKEDSDFLE